MEGYASISFYNKIHLKKGLIGSALKTMQKDSIVLESEAHTAQFCMNVFQSGVGSCLGCVPIKYIFVMPKLTKKSQSAVKFTHYRGWRVTFYLLILFDIFISPSSCIIHVVLRSV